MAFSTLTLAETAAKALIRQALWRKVKDNFDDHEPRLVQLEKQIRIFDHFNRAAEATTNDKSWGTTPATGGSILGRDWLLHASSNAELGNANAAKPSWSVVRIASPSAAGQWAQAQSALSLQFNEITAPITLEARIKRAVDMNFKAGMRGFFTDPTADSKGIWLEKVDASNWRFVSFDTARNNGASFAKVAEGNWFKVKIIFESSPSIRALCSVDGVLKETLTTQLPQTTRMHANFGRWDLLSGALDMDLADFGAVAIADAA